MGNNGFEGGGGRTTTSHDVRKLSFLRFCQRVERRIEDTEMEHICDDEKENRWVQTCSFHPYIKEMNKSSNKKKHIHP